ncbi:hypothetical protein AVEN_110029-1 [Araneus ventricosus]|uniref:Uncharacterized protein n=1 Tax=Araneus ventricosus TaxID=182803 RepID=A0A4Y2H3M0_ARAVE|nr:hypothetical protein AVEN_110029-1 [Araneus ventricosus]
MSNRSRKRAARKIGRALFFTRQPPEFTWRTSLQRRKQRSVASPVLHHSPHNSSAFDLQAAAAGKRTCGRRHSIFTDPTMFWIEVAFHWLSTSRDFACFRMMS